VIEAAIVVNASLRLSADLTSPVVATGCGVGVRNGGKSDLRSAMPLARPTDIARAVTTRNSHFTFCRI
jgi:hypothetical protein